MIKKHIGLLALAATIDMDKNGTAIFILFPVITIQSIDLITTLLKTLYLIQGNGSTHTGFTLTVRQIGIITNTILCILNDDMYFRPFLHQVTCQSQSNIIGIFIFMQFVLSHSSDSSRIGAAMPTDYIKARPCQPVGSHLHICQKFSKKRLISFRLPGRLFFSCIFFLGSASGSRYRSRNLFFHRRNQISHSQL